MQIACSHCGATYVFDATLIPKDGYDARCTSCQAVFFVHPDGEKSAQQPGPASQDSHDSNASDAVPAFAPESLHQGTMRLHEQEAPAARAPRDNRRATSMDIDLDLGARSGHPSGAANGRPRGRHTGVGDAEPMLMHKPWARRGLFLGVALVAVIGSGVVVGVVCSKRLHAPPSVQPPIHIVRAPDPIAAEAFTRGIKALWEDTRKGYIAAGKAFDAACARDPEFTDAWAGAALSALMLGTDVETEAQRAVLESQGQAREGLMAVARSAHPELSGEGGNSDDTANNAGRDGASVAQLLRLQKTQETLLRDSQNQAEALHQEAHALQRRGASLLLHGDHLMAQTPLMALALAMWYAADPASQQLARDQLRAFEQLVGGDCMPIESDPNTCLDANAPLPPAPALGPRVAQAPYGALAFWVEARLKAQDKASTPEMVVAAYERALTLQPELRRARWELAQYQRSVGQADVARPLLEDLAHGDAPHDKARAALQNPKQDANRAGSTP